MTDPAQESPSSLLRRFVVWPHAWLVLFAIAAATPAVLLRDSYLMGTFVTIALFSVVVVSLDLVMGYGGLPNFGVNGFFALGAFIMGVLGAKFGIPLFIGILAAVAINLLLAFLVGVATLRMRHYYFAVASFGFGIIVMQMLGGFPELTGGWSGLTGIPKPSVLGYPLASDLGFYITACALLMVTLSMGRNLVASRFGRAIQAISTDDTAAESVGIPVARHKILLFMFTSVFCSLAGSLYALYLRVPTPAHFDVPVLLELTLMLFLGGQRTLWGALVGATIMGLLPLAMEGFNDYTTALQGLTLMLILLFLPSGLAGKATQIFRSIGARGTARQPGPPAAAAVLPPAPESDRHRSDTESLKDTSGILLDVQGISKHFGGVAAVQDLSFQVRPGLIKAIIGPNGAGKTTAFNLLTRVFVPDHGQVLFRGLSLQGLRTDQVASLGIARTFQTPRLFGTMSSLENVKVGHHRHLRTGILGGAIPILPATRAEEKRATQSAWAFLELVGLGARAQTSADNLPFGERRLLEIARALASQPALLLLDEPAAGLNEVEKDRLAALLLSVRTMGTTLLLVEHDMRLVMSLADDIVVMNYGQKIAEGTPLEVRQSEAVLDAYLGRDTVSEPSGGEAHAVA